MTNYHVVASGRGRGELPRRVKVSLQGTKAPLDAAVIGYEEDKDLAVLKVDRSELPPGIAPIAVGASSALEVGQTCLAIGNPFGLDYTLTKGVVSALGREVAGAGGRPIKGCVQTDAAINPGNSGGPLLDSAGRLIGVNTAIYAPRGAGGNVGIGFAIPSDTVRRVVNQIIRFGQGSRPTLGINVLDDAIRKQYATNLRRPLDGALVVEVVEGSPAAAAGLRPCERQAFGAIALGDLITAVGGAPVATNEDLLCAVEESAPGEPLEVEVLRGANPGRRETLVVRPVTRKAVRAAGAQQKQAAVVPRVGGGGGWGGRRR